MHSALALTWRSSTQRLIITSCDLTKTSCSCCGTQRTYCPRQILTYLLRPALPPALHLLLLEHNPVPSLSDMPVFIQRNHAVYHLRDDSAVMATVDAPPPALRDDLQASIGNLTAAVAALCNGTATAKPF